MFASIGIFVLGAIAAGIVAAVFIIASGVELGGLEQSIQQGDPSGLLPLFVAYIPAMFIMLIFAAQVFNYWVTLAAFGQEEAKWSWSEKRFSAAVVNALKLLLLGILLAIVSFVVTSMLSALGLAPSFTEQMQMEDITKSVSATITSTLIMAVASCAVYSLFSANLTQTALRSNAEGLDHPYNVDFAIVLMLLYAIYLVPTTIAALTGSQGLTYLVSFVFLIHLMFTVPIAHGLRYRVCVAEKGERDTHG